MFILEITSLTHYTVIKKIRKTVLEVLDKSTFIASYFGQFVLKNGENGEKVDKKILGISNN